MNRPSRDWRREVNWSYVRLFFRAHLLMWVFGLVLVLLSISGTLVGQTRKLLGIIALLSFAASPVGVVPIFGTALKEDHEGPVYSFRTLLVFFCFLISSGGYMWLLSSIALSSIELW